MELYDVMRTTFARASSPTIHFPIRSSTESSTMRGSRRVAAIDRARTSSQFGMRPCANDSAT